MSTPHPPTEVPLVADRQGVAGRMKYGTSKSRMQPYEPFYTTRTPRKLPNSLVPSFGRGIFNHNTGKFHSRENYTDIEIGSVARWLNERAKGYTELPTT